MISTIQPIPDRPARPALTGPVASRVIAWSLLSLIPLIGSANHIRLWSKMPEPREQFALILALIGQITLSGMLFPWLFSNGRSAGFVIAGSALLVQLAGILADATITETARSIAWLAMWQIALLLITPSIRTVRAQQVAVAAATTAALGGILLLYLHYEFGSGEEMEPAPLVWFALAGVLAGAILNKFLRSRHPLHR